MHTTNLKLKKNAIWLQTRCIRSDNSPLFAKVKSKCSDFACSVDNMSTNTWNKQPAAIRNAENMAVCKKLLKNNAFQENG